MKTTLKMSVPAMVDFLTGIGSASTFVSMETETAPKLKKTCPFRGVIKKAIVQGWLNVDYKRKVEKMVGEALNVPAKDVNYELGDVWFRHVAGDNGNPSPVVVNKTKDDGKFYMFYFHRKTKEAGYFDETGKAIAYEDLKPHFYAKSSSEYKPEVRAVCLNNLKKLKARGLIVVGKK